ncbi:MAG: dienelactone hydrolase family protein, partial [bacterium]|nr:dienelactone hydrolase family protein [bacterium]
FEKVNPKKIGLWGHSMGGNVVLRSMVSKSEIPAVAVWAGAGFTYTDLQQYRISDTSYRPPQTQSIQQTKRLALFSAHGQFSPENEFWKQIAPTNYLTEIKGAIQLHHAIDDNVVSVEYSRNLNQILNNTNLKHQLNEYKTGGHNILGTSFSEAIQKTIDFYKDNL